MAAAASAVAQLLAACAALAAAGPAEVPTSSSPAPDGPGLTVAVHGLCAGEGPGHFALYDSPGHYSTDAPRLTGQADVRDGSCVWIIDNLPRGEYVIRFYHDVNGNGRLDRTTIGIPREPVAFSNGERPRFGPPRYARMRIHYDGQALRQDLKAFTVLGKRGRFGIGIGTVANQSPYDERDARIIAIPMISYIGDRLIITGPRVSYRLAATANTRTAALLQYSFDGFDTDESDILQGMHARDDTIMGGILFQIDPLTSWEFSTQLMTDLLNEHGGQKADLSLSRRIALRDVSIKPSVGVEWLSSAAAEHYYGVRDTEATPTRPHYRPGEAFSPVLDVGIRYSLTEAIAVFGNAEWTYLDAGIRDSPIVVRDSVYSFFLALAYAF